MSEMLCRQNFPTSFSPLLPYQMALVVESGRLEIVLGQYASHLLLIRTNSGYGTVLTAARARPGRSAIGLVFGGQRQTNVILSNGKAVENRR
jgi:hypothetical protein